MRISVVIPAYNAAGSIGAAIESCLQQTLPPYQVIVVDDASTDATSDIAIQYKGVFVITLANNSGPSAARNTGIGAATGDIIAFLDSDDTWLPEKLSVLHKLFAEHPEVEYIGHPYFLPGQSKSRSHTHELKEVSYLSVLLRNPYQPSCIAMRKSMSLRFDESYRYCEDHELSIRVAHSHNTYWLDTTLTQLGRPQLSAGGASGNKWNMRKGELRLYSSIYKHNPLYLPFIPFLWILSLAKMLYRTLFR